MAFHQWINVIDDIEVKATSEIFADYLYEENCWGVKCIICNSQECTSSQAHFSPFLVERMLIGESVQTRLIHCKRCECWFSQYRPNDLEMDNLYNGYRDEEYVKQRKKFEPQYSIQPYIDSKKKKFEKIS